MPNPTPTIHLLRLGKDDNNTVKQPFFRVTSRTHTNAVARNAVIYLSEIGNLSLNHAITISPRRS